MKLMILKSPGGYNNLIFVPQLPEAVEEKTLYLIANLIKDRFQFEIKMDAMGLGNFIEFEDREGNNLFVALDQEDGLSIDSKNLEFIEKMKDILEKEILPKVS